MAKRLRVVMANPPKLMRQLLLEKLKEEPWIEMVGEATQESEIRELAQKTAPDLVVVTADRPGRRPAICDELLSEFLALRLIAVTPRENHAVSYWASLEIHADEIESSECGFLGTVRKAAKVATSGSKVN
jgi:AmiR/NasT family two-component response regulator